MVESTGGELLVDFAGTQLAAAELQHRKVVAIVCQKPWEQNSLTHQVAAVGGYESTKKRTTSRPQK